MTRRQNLFSRFALSLSLAAGVLAVTTSASAQTPIHVTVPFAFTADNVSLPAGDYTVSTQPQSQSLMYLTNVKTGDTRILIVRSDEGESNAGPARLTFRRQPGGIYLSQVWSAGTSVHSELISHPKADKEIATSSKSSSTFDIATK